MKQSLPSRRIGVAGFSLLEILVSMVIILLILLVLVSMVDSTRRTWTYTTTGIEQFHNARDAFESITRRLSQATLNTYWDYHYPSGSSTPDSYIRQSELRFISGPGLAGTVSSTPPRPTHAVFFQAPLGVTSGTNYAHLDTMLNTVGYFIEFGSDKDLRPDCVNAAQGSNYRYRYRLKEMIEPAESLTLYKYTSGNSSYKGKEWFTTPLGSLGTATAPLARVMAENVIAFMLLPKLSPEEDFTGTKLSPMYSYDSTDSNTDSTINPKNQLPPVVQVTLVAIDEDSAARLANRFGTQIPDLGLANLFNSPGDLSDPTKPGYAKDLQTLQTTLVKQRINYRVFTTNVAIRAAKWSQEESK